MRASLLIIAPYCQSLSELSPLQASLRSIGLGMLTGRLGTKNVYFILLSE